MEQINRIELRGTVGSARVQVINGHQVARVTLVTNFVYKSREGEPVIETMWHNISLWDGKGIDDLTKIVKGSKLQVTGRLRSQRYTDMDGVERVTYEVTANKAALIENEEYLQYEMM